MKSLLIISVVLVVLLLPSQGFSKRGVDVTPLDAGLVNTRPRNIVTSLFTVTNTHDTVKEFISEVILPDGWKPITNDFVFSLKAGQSQTRILSFFIPQTAIAGQYQIKCMVKARKYPSISDFFIIHVNVEAVTAVSIEVINGPEYVIAGNEYHVDCVVLNESNQSVELIIDADSSQNFFYEIDHPNMVFEPAESKPVIITVISHSQFKRKAIDKLTISAQVAQNPDIKAQAHHTVEVIPRIFGANDIYHRLPVQLALCHMTTNETSWDSVFQAVFSGKGAIDEDHDKYLSFLFKAPDNSDKPLWGQYDEYHIQYSTTHYFLGAGDLNFELSPLTESGFSARGIEGNLRFGNILLGGYSAKERKLSDKEKQSGAYLEIAPREDHHFSLNFVSKTLENNTHQILSFYTETKPFLNTRLAGEYAVSVNGNGTSGHNSAYFTEIFYDKDRSHLKLKGLYADPNFQGYQKNKELLQAAGSYRINERWRIDGDIVLDKQHLDSINRHDQDINFGTAQRRKYYRLRLNHIVHGKPSFFLDGIRQKRLDMQPEPSFDYMEQSFRLGSNFNYGKWSFNAMAETGKTDDNLSGSESSFQRYILSTNFSHHTLPSGSGYISYDTSSDFKGLDRQRLTYGLNLKAWLGERTSLSVSARSTQQFEIDNDKQHDLKLSFDHTFASKWKWLNQSKISAGIRHSQTSNTNKSETSSVFASWTIPFNVPVARKKDFGSVKGKIFDKISKVPMADVVLKMNGDIAITDKNGRFVFPNVPAGSHFLSANASSLKEKKIFYKKMPCEITVKNGEDEILQLPVVEPASFSGEILVYGYKTPKTAFDIIPTSSSNNGNLAFGKLHNEKSKNDMELVKNGGLSYALVEMVNGSKVVRRLTDKKGRFSFDALVPGKYLMKIKAMKIPDYHRLEKDVFEIHLSVGEKKEMEIKVLPIKRSIKMLPSSPVIIEEGT